MLGFLYFTTRSAFSSRSSSIVGEGVFLFRSALGGGRYGDLVRVEERFKREKIRKERKQTVEGMKTERGKEKGHQRSSHGNREPGERKQTASLELMRYIHPSL